VSDAYDVYRPAGAQPEPTPGGGTWQVLVEYSNSGQAKPPTVVMVDSRLHDTFDAAHLAARDLAGSYEPPDPTFPQGRRVYRDGDGFLTVIDGAMSTFHFSTRVVSLLETT
jgi:hypothetical protein